MHHVRKIKEKVSGREYYTHPWHTVGFLAGEKKLRDHPFSTVEWVIRILRSHEGAYVKRAEELELLLNEIKELERIVAKKIEKYGKGKSTPLSYADIYWIARGGLQKELKSALESPELKELTRLYLEGKDIQEKIDTAIANLYELVRRTPRALLPDNPFVQELSREEQINVELDKKEVEQAYYTNLNLMHVGAEELLEKYKSILKRLDRIFR